MVSPIFPSLVYDKIIKYKFKFPSEKNIFYFVKNADTYTYAERILLSYFIRSIS